MIRIFMRINSNYFCFLLILILFLFEIEQGFSVSIAKNQVKVICSQKGIYKIARQQLEKLNWEGVNADPATLHLRSASGEHPFHLIDNPLAGYSQWQAIEFWVDPAEIPNAYQPFGYLIFWLYLEESPGLRYAIEPPVELIPDAIYVPSSFLSSFTINQNALDPLAHMSPIPGLDYWFVLPKIPGGMQTQVSFDCPNSADMVSPKFSCNLTIYCQSDFSETTQLLLFLNQKRLGALEITPNQIVNQCITSTSSYNLKSSNNVLTITHLSPHENTNLYIDKLQFAYSKFYRTETGCLFFHPPDTLSNSDIQFQINGFDSNDITIYKKDVSQIIPRSIHAYCDEFNQEKWRCEFVDHPLEACTEYIAVMDFMKKTPDFMELVAPLKQTDAADLLIMLPHDSFYVSPDLDRFRSLKSQEGLSTQVLILKDIFNTYSDGYPHPNGIRKFLNTIFQQSDTSPRYCLLVGTGKQDFSVSPDNGNLCPVPLVHTLKYGATPSDTWYEYLTETSSFPRLAIGRLPVNNRSEFKTCLQKIINYSNYHPSPWMNRYLSIVSSGTVESFYSQSENLVDEQIPKAMEVQRLYITDINENITHSDILLNYFEQGMLFVNYRGHGGHAIWSHADLLSEKNVNLINNANCLPFILSLTCFTANFTLSHDCLGKALVCNSRNGAIAFLGATGYGWVQSDFEFAKTFYRTLFANRNLPIGSIIQIAKHDFLQENQGELAKSTVDQYTLIGDPSLNLHIPDTFTNRNQIVQINENSVSGFAENNDTQISITGLDTSETNIWNRILDVDKGDWAYSIPQIYQQKTESIRLYQWHKTSKAHTHELQQIKTEKIWVDSIYSFPERPTETDSVFIFLKENSNLHLHSLSLNLQSPYPLFLEMNYSFSDSIWQTAQPLPPFTGGTDYQFSFEGELDGVTYHTQAYELHISTLPSLVFDSCKMTGHLTPELQCLFKNNGDLPIENSPIQIECLELSIKETVPIVIDPHSLQQVTIPFSAPPGTYQITIESECKAIHSEIALEVTHFLINAAQGTSKSGPVGLKDQIMVSIPPLSVAENCILSFDKSDTTAPLFFSPIYSLELTAHDSTVDLLKPVEIILLSDKTMAFLQPYHYDPLYQTWSVLPFERSGKMFRFKTSQLGKFALQNPSDHTGPTIEIQTQKQILSSTTSVSAQAIFTILLEDSSGLDLSNQGFSLFLDEKPVSHDAIIIPGKPIAPKRLTLRFQPNLSDGLHSLQFQCQDIHGNQAQTPLYHLNVNSTLTVQCLGNYPNPFKHETVFVIVTSGLADKLDISIYTTSGRKIRYERLDSPFSDYIEWIWDGCDNNGCEIENGVYFYKIIATHNKKTVHQIGKLAKIQ